MGDIPSVVDYLVVTLQHRLAISDSNDAGALPDAVATNGRVVIQPIGLPRPYVVAGSPPAIYSVGAIVCSLVNGVLYGPADGHAVADAEVAAGPIAIINPLSGALSDVGWKWQADFTPSSSNDGWSAFSVVFNAPTESDGKTVNLAAAALLETNTNAVAQPVTWPVVGDGTHPPSVPLNSQPGQFVLDTTTWTLYLIGA